MPRLALNTDGVRDMTFMCAYRLYIGKMPQALGKLWLLVSMALGVIFVWMMTCVYQIDTVPTWHNGYTTLAFFLTVLLSGPIVGAGGLGQIGYQYGYIGYNATVMNTVLVLLVILVYLIQFAGDRIVRAVTRK